jgi:HAD superfamily hydrolase (TIGR01549 family)
MAATTLLFDLDGTLWDSYPWYAEVIGAQGSVSRETVLARLRAGEAIVHIARDAGVPVNRFQTAGRPGLYPGVEEGLRELHRRGTRLGVVTSLSPHLVLPALRALGIEGFFGEAVVHPGNCRSRKPNPGGLLNALVRLSTVPSKEAFYVGDRKIDAQAATNAGISFAWAAYGYGDAEPENSTAILNGFADVLRL